MYKLKKVEKIADDNDICPAFNKMSIELYDVDNRIPYGRGGGINWDNTEFYKISLEAYRYETSWFDTWSKITNSSRWVADLNVEFEFKQSYLRGNEVWENSFDKAKLIELVEESYKNYINNIDINLGDEVKISGNKFWSDKYMFNIGVIQEKLESTSNQESSFCIVQSNLDFNTKGELVYIKDHDKTVAKVPKRFKVISKEELYKKIRVNFLKVANRFLCQDFINSLNEPDIMDLLTTDKTKLLQNLETLKNKTVFTDIIKK